MRVCLQDDELKTALSGVSDLSEDSFALATSRSLPAMSSAKKSLFPHYNRKLMRSMGEGSAMGGGNSFFAGGASSMHGGHSMFAPAQSAFALSPYSRTMSMVSLGEAASPASFASNAFVPTPSFQSPLGAPPPCCAIPLHASRKCVASGRFWFMYPSIG
jgi:hypothetical protein